MPYTGISKAAKNIIPPVARTDKPGRYFRSIIQNQRSHIKRSKNILKVKVDKNRIYGLDIMRACAILFVLVGHGNNLYNNEALKQVTNWFVFDGVSIFFVLSGFLIGGILIKILEQGNHSFKGLFSFWTKRWFRTLPAYFFILISLLLLCTVVLHYPIISESKRFFVFLQNFNTEHTVFFQEAWSLSIEEWFYILVPGFLFLLTGAFRLSNKKAILFTTSIVILFVLAFRVYRYQTIPILSFEEWDQIFRKQVVTRLDSLMFGVAGAYIAYYHKQFWTSHKLMLLIAGISLFIIDKLYTNFTSGYGVYYCVFSFDITAIGALFLLPYLTGIKTGNGFIFKILTHVSLISYSLYLINLSLMQGWVLKYMPWFGLKGYSFILVRYSCYWIFTLTGATLLYKYFEKPVMNLRSRTSI